MNWRDLPVEELARQYNNRGLVPDHGDFFATWADWSEDYRSRAPAKLLDVAYGPGEAEKLDLFLPRVGNAPLHLFIHGGYWQSMGRKDFSFVAESVNDHGAAVAVMSYGLCPTVTMDEIVAQVRACAAFLLGHGRVLGIDASRISISGHSAGGHLGAMLCATDFSTLDSDLPNNPVSGAVLISGLYDLQPLVPTPINDKVGMDMETAERNSPVHLPPRTRAPILCVTGSDESPEFHRQMREFTGRWAGTGAHITATAIPATHHFSVVEAAFEVGGPILAMIDSAS